jgi:formylglycine-generating enzyme required for sulfatase activity
VNPRIPREVETIVMKTLEKDPERRYENAEGFAEDIDRYLSGEPILARPPSFTYRTWKKMKKYKVVSVSVLTAVIAIVAVAVYFINERIEIKKRQDARFRKYIEKAQGLLAGGDYVGAKSLYIQAKTLRPDDLKVARGLDKVQLGIREREKNRDEREAKERAADAASEGNDMLEKARQATDRFDAKTKYFDAMREFDRALANDSNNEDGKLGKYNAAVKLGELNMQDKDFGVAMLMFSFAEGLGVNDKKAKELVGAARKARQRAEAFVSLLEKANQLMAAGSWDEAVRHLERAIEFEGITVAEKQDVQERIREASYSRYFWEGEAERKKGNTAAAIAAFLKAETFKDTPEVAERLRSVRYGRSVRKGSDHLVREEFTEALKAYLQARQYADNPAEAIELIEQCRDRGFNHCSALAMAAKASRDWMEAGEHLKQALTFRPENLGTRKLKAEVAAAAACPEKPEKMVYVFSSKLTVGSAVLDDRNSLREVFVDFFYIDRFEVTNKRYKVFVGAGGYSQETYWDSDGYKQIEAFVDRTGKPGPATWENGTFPQGKEDFPVTGVSWYEARAYARWAGKRLPTEEEWEKAASCDPEETGAKLTYPWGDDWDPDKGNFKDDEVTKVGSFPNDVSPAGCFDMGGNAFEWTSSSYKEEYRVIRGGSVGLSESTLKRFARITKRKCPKPSYRSRNTGFRCALTPER